MAYVGDRLHAPALPRTVQSRPPCRDNARAKAPRAVRIGLETGSTSAWLARALRAQGLPVICLDARHAHAALSIRRTKTDRSDARGLAEMLRMGWYREVQVKRLEAHERRALLAARHRLVVMRVDLDGQIRGILKTFGLIAGPGSSDAFLCRAEALAEGHAVLAPLVTCLAQVPTGRSGASCELTRPCAAS